MSQEERTAVLSLAVQSVILQDNDLTGGRVQGS